MQPPASRRRLLRPAAVALVGAVLAIVAGVLLLGGDGSGSPVAKSAPPATRVTSSTATTTAHTAPAHKPTPHRVLPRLPVVGAAAWGVVDGRTGAVLAGHRLDEQRPVASIGKLMTALVVRRHGGLDDDVTIPPLALVPDESVIGLRTGEQQTRAVLLRALLVVSAGDAAEALAATDGGTRPTFVRAMNLEAHRLGLRHTRYTNPVGLDEPGQRSTARDVLRLARKIMQDQLLREIVGRTSARLHGRTLPATNTLLGHVAGADGVKTGHTRGAGYCIVASARRHGRRMYVVVLGAASIAARNADATKLLDWAFRATA
jgi:D-alanyl-D-alanine carboxypeptidase (penicillin-binding protein 5/6)